MIVGTFFGAAIFLLTIALQMEVAKQVGLGFSIAVPALAAVAAVIALFLRRGRASAFERRAFKTVLIGNIVMAVADLALVMKLLS